jgi:heat shock protein HslJ
MSPDGSCPSDQQSKYTISFKADGTLAATADCNGLTGTYTVADNAATSGSMTISIDAGTRVACPDGSLGDLYGVGLFNAASYAISGGALTITLKDDGSLVSSGS